MKIMLAEIPFNKAFVLKMGVGLRLNGGPGKGSGARFSPLELFPSPIC